jgi:hypothetical protein
MVVRKRKLKKKEGEVGKKEKMRKKRRVKARGGEVKR